MSGCLWLFSHNLCFVAVGYDECEDDVKQDKSRKEYANKGMDLRCKVMLSCFVVQTNSLVNILQFYNITYRALHTPKSIRMTQQS